MRDGGRNVKKKSYIFSVSKPDFLLLLVYAVKDLKCLVNSYCLEANKASSSLILASFSRDTLSVSYKPFEIVFKFQPFIE